MMQPCPSGSLSLLRVDEGQMGPRMSHSLPLPSPSPHLLKHQSFRPLLGTSPCQPCTVPWVGQPHQKVLSGSSKWQSREGFDPREIKKPKDWEEVTRTGRGCWSHGASISASPLRAPLCPSRRQCRNGGSIDASASDSSLKHRLWPQVSPGEPSRLYPALHTAPGRL